MIIVSIIMLLVYIAAPFWAKIILTILNFFIPDGLPAIDELIMVGGVLRKMMTLGNILDFFKQHKFLRFLALFVGLPLVIVLLIIIS